MNRATDSTQVLIASFPGDTHATAVAETLHRKGTRTLLWMNTDFPTRDGLSLYIDKDTQAQGWTLIRGGERTLLQDLRSVWYRRPSFGLLPDSMHPGDRRIAAKECEAFLRGTWFTLSTQGAFWVNDPLAAFQATSKAWQLQIAAAVGLEIPETLFANDPDAIRDFIDRHDEVIFKTFFTWVWKSDEKAASSYTARLNRENLPADRVLRLSPGILQPLLHKSHELRVVICGTKVVSYRIDSQAMSSSALDWRQDSFSVPTRLDQLDEATEKACLALMKRLGLAFGCLDLIVTPDGRIIFLEVNQMGQWLWLEDMVPDFPLLDMFAEFPAQGRPDFVWDPLRARVRWHEIKYEILDCDKRLQTQHVPYPNQFLVSD